MADIVTGIPEFSDAIDSMVVRVNGSSREFVTKGGAVIAKNAKRQFAEGSQPAPWRGPNFPTPTRHTGNLQSSIRTTSVSSLGSGRYQSTTGPTIIYGRRIELGYTGTGQWPYFTTRPFPFLAPGLEKSRSELNDLYTELVTAAQEA